MRRITYTLLLGISLFMPSVLARKNQDVTGTITRPSRTFPEEAKRCTVAESREEMESTLKQVGWPFEIGVPVINWEKDCAVIIAPGTSYNGYNLAFRRLTETNGKFILYWGWLRPEQKRTAPSQGGISLTLGNTVVGPILNTETLVVAIKHHIHADDKLLCQEEGPE